MAAKKKTSSKTKTQVVVRSSSKKAPAKKAIAKKPPAKKAVAKKAPVKKAPAKKAIAKKLPVKKAVAKKAPVKKAPSKKAVAKKHPVKTSAAKKVPAKKAAATKTLAKKSVSKKSALNPKGGSAQTREVQAKAVKASIADAKKKALVLKQKEQVRIQKERENLRLLKQRETEKKEKEREKLRLLKEKERIRLSKEKEKQKLAKAKEQERVAKEREKARLAKEKQKVRLLAEKEKAQKAEEREKLRVEKEKERENVRIAKEKQREKARVEKEKEKERVRKAREIEKVRVAKEREKEKIRLAKEKEKERIRIEKENEKERVRAEKEKEKERARIEKEKEAYRKAREAERERVRLDKETARLALEGRVAQQARRTQRIAGTGRGTSSRVYRPDAIPSQAGTSRSPNEMLHYRNTGSGQPRSLVRPSKPPTPPKPPKPSTLEGRWALITQRLSRMPETFQRDYRESFDMSWIHHDSALEGVVYTYQELKTAVDPNIVIVPDSGLQPVCEEVRRHKLALEWVRELGSKETPLTAEVLKRIYLLLHPEEGDLKSVKYRKEVPQHRLYFHEYSVPDKIAVRIRQAFDWFHGPEPTKLKDPLRVAARLHYDLLRTFPFPQDSGKVARMLMNIHLMRNGYPPVIIHSTERQRYYDALRGSLPTIIQMVNDSLSNSLASIEKVLDEEEPTKA